MSNTDNEITTLPWTGERYLPSIHGGVELEHFHRYLFAEQMVKGKQILDIASGEGYGSALLARSAVSVTGVDISAEAVLHAQEKYKADNLEYCVGSCAAIPLADHSIDMVVSFETIEHHDEHDAMMAEIKRVLKHDGILLISCPDKYEYSDKPGYKNEYHVKELYRGEFEQLLAGSFKKHIMFGQRAAYGSLILQEEGLFESITHKLEDRGAEPVAGLSNAVYLIAIASDGPIPVAKIGLLNQDLMQISDITDRDAWILSLNQTIQSLIVDRDAQKAGYEQLLGTVDSRSLEYSKLIHLSQTDEVTALRAELQKIHQSMSWRITYPIRKAIGFLRRLFNENAGLPHQTAGAVQPNLNYGGKRTDELTLADGALQSARYRVLLVSYYCPTRAHAGGLRILDIYTLMRQRCPDARIDLLTYSRPDIDWSFNDANNIFDNIYLSSTDDLNPEELCSLQETVSPKYDVVDLQFHQSARRMDDFRTIGLKIIFTPMESQAKALYLDLVAKFRTGKVLGFKRILASAKVAIEEICYCRKADQVVCVSETDASFLRIVSATKKIFGIDTGISQIEFGEALKPGYVPQQAAKKSSIIIYVAYFGSQTNIAAMLWFLDNVHPLIKEKVPGYVLSVVGRGDLSIFEKYKDNSLDLIGEVPEIAPYISCARVGIAPGLSGSGLRGKVNQYAVLGVPCVVSPVAFKGLAYRNGESICVAEAPGDFAKDCIQLLTDLEFNEHIAKAARDLCIERYSWHSKWPQICDAYAVKGVV